MPGALTLAGWLLALLSLGAAAVVRVRLGRHMEAVARACHELRNPLAALRLGLEPGSRVKRLPQSRLRALELELGRATLALEDLAAARRPRRPRSHRVPAPAAGEAPVALAELIGASVEAWRPAASRRGVRLHLSPVDSGLRVSGVRLRLAQALGNLIANAIEHGGGEVAVSAGVHGGSVRIEVEDGGPGLPKPIDQLSRARDRRLGGRRLGDRGHGLPVAAAIAAAHGGRLAAGSSDRGARLVLELPAHPPNSD